MLTDAAWRLATQGIDQWPVPFPRELVAASVQRRETYLVCQGAMAIATLALSWDDPTFWGLRPTDAGYVHRLAVARVKAGRGLGAEVLDWAGEQVAKAGRRVLRLDCATGNAGLRAYYERAGFIHQTNVEIDRGAGARLWPAALYERSATGQGNEYR